MTKFKFTRRIGGPPPWIGKILLWLIMLVGAFYRFYRLNWDEGFYFHPDERNIAVAVGRISFFKQLDPGFFAYNGFWIYLTRAVGGAIAVMDRTSAWFSDWAHINLITRSLSASFSLISIYLTYLVAKKLIGVKAGLPAESAGLIAAFVSAFSVGYIQYAHYGVTESILVFWVLLITLLSLHRRWRLLALSCGLAVATKTSALSFLIIPFVTYLTDVFDSTRRRRLLSLTPILVLIFLLSLFIATPYSFLDWTKFRESMNYESGVVSGVLQVPYTLQFHRTRPYLFFFTNLFWTLGPVLPILGSLGLIAWLLSAPFTRKTAHLPFVIFGLVYFLYVGSWYTKFIRYLLPIYPVLIISAVWLLLRFKKFFVVYLTSTILLLTAGFVWSSAYLQIYTQTSTRLLASRWIYLNLPARSTILTEHWDDRVPIDLPNRSDFRFVQLTNYEPDSISKTDSLSQTLARGDYLVLSSRRLSGSIGQAADLYPLTSRYYSLLFAEKLGFVLIKRFSVYPRLGPIVINDDLSEETFQVYDHPVVTVFVNRDHLSPSQLKVILNAAHENF